MAWFDAGLGSSGGGGGSGGHTILNNSGISLTQRTQMQFIGANSIDDSTNNKTVVRILRSMTKAEFDLLTEAEKQGIINVTGATSDEMTLYIDGKKYTTVEETECSVTLGSTMPSSMGLPTIIRSGSVVILNFGITIPSGTYSSSAVLWNVEPKPKVAAYGVVRYGSSPVNIVVKTNGTVTFNTEQSGNHWVVGQIVYLA